MDLTSGRFTIFNEGSNTTRNLHEDKSLNPKGVFCPADSGEHGDWEIKRLHHDRYILECRGAPTGVKHHLLYAFLDGQDKPEQWNITRREPSGLYTIETEDGKAGWVAPVDGEGNNQVLIQPLKVGKSDPPFFPPNELWKFVAAHSD